ncbi:AAA-domain-containing protein [Choiromyces venosus 120613-1]|uniref:AAA-domain-containing protein n=1 Tax=Choiromyces venosus 120613-1 TaxID=1336337 RepID=A0A3N4IXR8_9PEZI|nr:AAA-domain-containing protein [Choiromyces venosus 120613-1]
MEVVFGTYFQWIGLTKGLVESKYIYDGLSIPSTEYKGTKRLFQIEKVTGEEDTPVENRAVIYKATLSTVVEIISSSSSASKPVILPASSLKSSKDPTPQSDSAVIPPSKTNFSSIGGLTPQITTLKTLLLSTLHHSHHFTKHNLTPPRGILLYGPPGTGKTLLLKAIASEISAKCYVLNGSVVGKYLGESEAAIRKVFAEARKNQPAVVFMDEVDSIAPKRGEGDGNEGRIVSTILTEMDGMAYGDGAEAVKLVVVAATSRPNAIDQALRRPGRFDREVEIGIPNVDSRREILEILTRDIDFSSEQPKETMIKTLAAKTHGFVGADLEALVRTAFTSALKRLEQEDLDLSILTLNDTPETHPQLLLREEDIDSALKDVRPTAMREIFLEPPKVRWSDIGGQEEVKQRLREAVEWPLTHPEAFARLGGTPRKGLLLYGPPGCSKTLTAKALATEAGLNFMAVKGPELFNMYLGESERAVREVFRKARAASPSIIFFDEIDALSASRDDGGRGGGGGGGKTNVLTTLLNEMDGIEVLKGVTILAATNRPEIIDPALLRPGRLDTILYVGPPDLPARKQILQIKTGKMSISPGVDLDHFAEATEGFSGAEVVNVCDEAIHYAMRESFSIEAVCARHFEAALEKAVPQITAEMREAYENWSVGGVKKI